MTQHSTAAGGGPADDDHGPPDWFAAVAEPEPEPEAEPQSSRGRRYGRGPEAEPDPRPESARAPGRVRPSARRGPGVPEVQDGPGLLGGGLGLVPASELPGGRRRRRSALAEETIADHRTVGEAAGHGGAAASFPPASGRPGGRRARKRSEPVDEEYGFGPGRAPGRGDRGSALPAGDVPPGDDTLDSDGPGTCDPDSDDPGGAGSRGHAGRRGAQRSRRSEQPRRAAAEESADPEARARDICLRLLTGAAKTRKQLADALRQREIPEDVADGVLSRLEEVGLIDDAAFARSWVESRHTVRGLSRRALAQELRTKGVAGELAEQALAQLDQDDETEAARELVERRLRTTRGLERQARMRRLVGMLARRGYSEGLAFRVVREALDAERTGAGPDGEDVDGPSAHGWD
ncbi:RecX family transcriptional regulator [Kitasatospora hibisci]|uniref:RecX family transcriptional regulator n=1 Tax=Kitasatospora hibisci TaxID=3369522 RepID=UPI003754B5B2